MTARCRELLETVHLSDFAHSWVHELSGGMKQKVALARALAVDPAVLLMDEPFGALDAMTRDVLHAELQELWIQSSKTVLFVTHNVREAAVLGDRILVMSRSPGRIVAEFDVDLPRPRNMADDGIMDHRGARPRGAREVGEMPARNRTGDRMPVPHQRTIFAGGLLGLWLAAGLLELWPSYVFPTLPGVVSAIWNGIDRGTLPLAMLGSLRRLAVGLLHRPGRRDPHRVPDGGDVVVQEHLRAARARAPDAAQHLLAAAVDPLVRAVGEGHLFVVVMGAFLSIALAAEDGIRNTPKVYLQAARNLGASGLRALPVSHPALRHADAPDRHEAWMVLRMEVADGGRADLRRSRAGLHAEHGAGAERHEPGGCGHSGHHDHRPGHGQAVLLGARTVRTVPLGDGQELRETV